jgi:single-strand DNA-binding protein
MNQVSLTGRLGADPEEFAYGEKRGARFRLAVNRPQKDADADWFDVTVFEPSSAFVLDYMTKGARVGVEGRLQVDTWEKDGQKRSAVKIIAHRVEGLESKREREAAGTAAPAPRQQATPTPQGGVDWTTDESEDPFGDQ